MLLPQFPLDCAYFAAASCIRMVLPLLGCRAGSVWRKGERGNGKSSVIRSIPSNLSDASLSLTGESQNLTALGPWLALISVPRFGDNAAGVEICCRVVSFSSQTMSKMESKLSEEEKYDEKSVRAASDEQKEEPELIRALSAGQISMIAIGQYSSISARLLLLDTTRRTDGRYQEGLEGVGAVFGHPCRICGFFFVVFVRDRFWLEFDG